MRLASFLEKQSDIKWDQRNQLLINGELVEHSNTGWAKKSWTPSFDFAILMMKESD